MSRFLLVGIVSVTAAARLPAQATRADSLNSDSALVTVLGRLHRGASVRVSSRQTLRERRFESVTGDSLRLGVDGAERVGLSDVEALWESTRRPMHSTLVGAVIGAAAGAWLYNSDSSCEVQAGHCFGKVAYTAIGAGVGAVHGAAIGLVVGLHPGWQLRWSR